VKDRGSTLTEREGTQGFAANFRGPNNYNSVSLAELQIESRSQLRDWEVVSFLNADRSSLEWFAVILF
jgi:hypothetical protein